MNLPRNTVLGRKNTTAEVECFVPLISESARVLPMPNGVPRNAYRENGPFEI